VKIVKRIDLALLAAALFLGLVVPTAGAALAPAPRGASGGATRFLVRPEGRIAYEEVGAGPLVVLVPGIGDTRQQYRFLAPELAAAGYRVVSMDLRGLGESSTGFSDYSAAAVGSDVVALLRELDAGPAGLVGQSMAAGAVAWAAAEAPDRVESLVLIGPFVRDVPPTSWLQGALMNGLVNGMLQRPWGASAWSSYYDSLYPSAKPVDLPAYRAALSANVAERGRLEALRAMMNASKADVDARLEQVRARTLVVMGTADPDFDGFVGGPAGEARVVADRLHGQVLMVEGAGHYPHVEMPARVDPAIVRFVDGRGI
jgi:pimeloyl-ACP methyl ester carboxylesterase